MGMEFKEINREACSLISEQVVEELKNLEKKYGIKFEAAGGNFTKTNYTMKLSASIVESGKVLTRESEAFKKNAHLYGFKSTDLGRQFLKNNTIYKITGLNTRGRKFKILGERMLDGVAMKFTVDSVLSALKG